jgi:hypothetical protein
MSLYIYVNIQCLPIDKKDAIYTIFIVYICRRLQRDCHWHRIGSPQAGVMRKSIVQPRRHSFKDQYRLAVSCISSVLALEYISVYFLLYTPQVASASAYIEAPHSEAHCGWGANSTVQSPFGSSDHDSYILDINEPRKVWICSYARPALRRS